MKLMHKLNICTIGTNQQLTIIQFTMKRILLTTCLLAFSIFLMAANQQQLADDKSGLTLRVRVKDGITGSVVAGAGVYINELGGTYIADGSGLATIPNLSSNTEYNYSINTGGIYTTATGSVFMETSDKLITVYLYPPGYTVTFKINNANTNAPIEGASVWIMNTIINLTTNSQGEASVVLPNNLEDYTYSLVCEGYIPKMENTFHLYGSNITVNNTMEPAYNLCLRIYGSGSIVMNSDQTFSSNECMWLDWDESVTLEAIANEGYRFSHWEVYVNSEFGPPELDYTSEEPELAFTMNSDKDVRVYFEEIIQYPVTFNVSDGVAPIQNALINIFETELYTNADGQAVISLEDRTYSYTISKDGFDTASGHVTVDGAPETVNVTLSEPSDDKTLTIILDGDGAVKVNGLAYTQSVSVPAGTQLTILAVPNDGNTFVTWSGDLWSTSAEETVTMDEDMTITANFSPVSSITSSLKGSIRVYPNPCSSNLSVQAPTKYSRVTVTDLIGRVVIDMQHDFGQTLNLNTQSIPKGIYLVTLMSHNGQKTVTRVVRQ